MYEPVKDENQCFKRKKKSKQTARISKNNDFNGGYWIWVGESNRSTILSSNYKIYLHFVIGGLLYSEI